MLLGKRPRRPPIKRTTSLSEITFDLDVHAISSSSSTDTSPSPSPTSYDPFSPAATHNQLGYGGGHHFPQRSPRTYNRRASADFLEPAQFLRSCFLCNRSLVPTRDIYIYKGDSAFCSLECRQEQMSKDEKREKWSAAVASKKDVAVPSSTAAAADHVSTTTTNGEIATVAAVYLPPTHHKKTVPPI